MTRFPLSALCRIATFPVAGYIVRERDRLSVSATVLPDAARATVRSYFLPEDLDRVRTIECDPLPVSDLPFRGTARCLGLDLPDVSLAAAITFDHVIAAREPLAPALLFHELVHAVQYRLLGVREFARLYVRGLLFEGGYDGIPLERCAYELGCRFEIAGAPFDVAGEIREWIACGCF
jgi:hypothetical protein